MQTRRSLGLVSILRFSELPLTVPELITRLTSPGDLESKRSRIFSLLMKKAKEVQVSIIVTKMLKSAPYRLATMKRSKVER
jgi:hypothetical protein